MLKVIDGGKSLLYRVTKEIKNDVVIRRENGEAEWNTLLYVIKTCKDGGLKASEAAAIVYMNYRLLND